VRIQRSAFAALLLAAAACGAQPQSTKPAGDVEGRPSARDPWQDARERGVDFRALGQEPGWFLEIDDGRSMRLVYDYAEREATRPGPTPTIEQGKTTYAAATGSHRLIVVIDDRPCQDVMSGEPFPSTVTVTIDGRELRGCGRSLR
jgi:putative lipoprotein